MALSVQRQAIYWGAFVAAFFALLWGLGDVLMPFLMGAVIAYLLDPLADWLEDRGMHRALATTLISLFMVLALVLLLLAIIPSLVGQAVRLFRDAPSLAQNLQDAALNTFPELNSYIAPVRDTFMGFAKTLDAQGAALARGVLQSAKSLLSVVSFALIVPVVVFYMLLDWNHMVAKIDAILPRQHLPILRRLFAEIDRTLAGFVRGHLSVCFILAGYYIAALMLVGMEYALIVGAFAGAITFIPYVGALFGGALAIGLAMVQFWGDMTAIGIVVAIFVLGQFIEGNVLTPRLVGRAVGLHPVLLLLSLAVFGNLFGFAGMLVAVPLAAVIGVMFRFALEKYKDSRLYSGDPPQ